MIPDATFEPAPPSKLRLRFSLLALLLFVTVVCLLLAWWAQPRRVVATSLFQVSSTKPTLWDDTTDRRRGQEDFEIVKQTQIAQLKSHFVLNSAMRSPGIASLPIFAGRDDPVAWLQDRLEASFPQQGEILAITLSGPEEYAQDLVRVVDVVAAAYKDEVIFVERQRRLANRDLLEKTRTDLNREISRKSEELVAVTDESETAARGGELLQQVDLKRLERVETEMMRLEGEQLELQTNGDSARTQFLEKRIAQLREQQKEIESRIVARGRTSVELTTRENELKQLQRIANELATKLERMEIEANAPDRIRQIQQAVVSPK